MLIKSKLVAITILLMGALCRWQVAEAQSGVCSWGSSSYTWVADFNLDGKADIASANGSNVYIYLSTGLDFIFETWMVPGSWGSSEYTWVADFNGDKKPDIASADGDSVYIHLSTGTGFINQTWTVPGSWGTSGYTRVADFSGDKKADIASATVSRGAGILQPRVPAIETIYVLLSTGTGFNNKTWTAPATRRYSVGTPEYTWAADFNGDKKPDIASADGDSVYMYLYTDTRFNNQTWAVPGYWGSSEYTWAADFNGDGKTDIASADGGNIYMHLSTGTGFNNQTWTVPGSWGTSGYTWAADFNGDGKADIASANGSNVYMHLSTGANFTNVTWTVPGSWGGSDYTWVADFNGDGKADIASADGCTIHMHLSLGNRFANEDWFASSRPSHKIYVRKNIYKLTAAEITSLKAGVAAMKARPDSVPTSWVYQAKMHGVLSGPVKALQNNCQHGQFFFLSWHRMFIYYFERILRKASGDSNFALPYWNYTDVDSQRIIPEPFRLPANISTNPLYNDTRDTTYNKHALPLPEADVQYRLAFKETNFTTTTAGKTSFGGFTIWSLAHNFNEAGLLEKSPHNNVHNDIGGDMAKFEAPRDPIFWLHHANIDRLWSEWLALGNGRVNPIDSRAWMDQDFFFYDENSNQVLLKGSQILDNVTQLYYRYDDEPSMPSPVLLSEVKPLQEKVIASEILLTQKHLTKLTERKTEVNLDFQQDKRRSLSQSWQNKFKNESVVLQIKGIQNDESVGVTFLLYLNLPDTVRNPDHTHPYFIGTLGFFGTTGPSAQSHHGAPAGLTYNYDITEVLLNLKDSTNLRLVVIPSFPKAPAGRKDLQEMIDAKRPNGNPRFNEVEIIKHRLE